MGLETMFQNSLEVGGSLELKQGYSLLLLFQFIGESLVWALSSNSEAAQTQNPDVCHFEPLLLRMVYVFGLAS